MNEKHTEQETGVEQMRRVRDQLNREIETTSGKALLDQIGGHRYSNPFLQRLASKAAQHLQVRAADKPRLLLPPVRSAWPTLAAHCNPQSEPLKFSGRRPWAQRLLCTP